MPPRSGPATRTAVVVGAGIAGAACARALARHGWSVAVVERDTAAAQRASGNPGGLFHGSVHADDTRHARLLRAAALTAADDYHTAIAAGVAGAVDGLLRLETRLDIVAMTARLQGLALPAEYVAAVDAAEASWRAGVRVAHPAWHYPTGGWVDPGAWVRLALAKTGIALRCGAAVAALRRAPGGWAAVDAAGAVLARGTIAVVATGDAGVPSIDAALSALAWPTVMTRGQVSHWRCDPKTRPLRLPLAGGGYALPLADGVLCGATRQAGDEDATVRDADHAHNVDRYCRLTGLPPPARSALRGRVGWRLDTSDRLPIAGAWPAGEPTAATTLRRLPREPGLFVLTALGSRGLTLAPLLGRLVAAQASATPWPIEQDLADAVDPARWRLRAARRAEADGGGRRW